MCSFDHSKCRFFKALNAILAKLGGSHLNRLFWIWYVPSTCQYSCTVLNLVHWLYATKGHWSSQLLARWWNCSKLDQPRLSAIAKIFFGFLPITYQIDIRTARFLETFVISDNGICMLFERHAKIGIYSRRMHDVNSVSDLRCAIDELFLSASLYVSKRGAYWDRLCRDVVGRWLVGRWLSRACTVAKRCILGL